MKPAGKHISSQDKQVFQTTENTSGSVETRLLYVVLSGPSSPVVGQREFLQGRLILAGGFENGQEVKRVSKSGIDCLTDLYSDQEDADPRLVLHAIHLAQSHSNCQM